MASIRGSKRSVKVTASCGHITMTTVQGSGNGSVSRRNISENQNQPCLDCRASHNREHNCKHGVDVYNCYDGCYDEMKNGTVS